MVYQTAPFSMTLNDPNLVVKVTPFFDTKYLTNGYRYGHSLVTIKTNRIPHPSFRMAPVSMTLSDLSATFQGHDIIQRQITQKEYKIDQ